MVTADGDWGNWTFSKSLDPDVEVLDFWHAAEKLKVAADAAFGPDEKASTEWFEAKRHILRHDPKGAGKSVNRHARKSHIQRSIRTHCGTEGQLGGAAAGPARSSRRESTLLAVPSLLDEKGFLRQMRAGQI